MPDSRLILIDELITAPHQIADLVQPLGYHVNVSCTQDGPTRGRLRVTCCGNQLFLGLVSNKTLTITGSRLGEFCLWGMFLDDYSSGKRSLAHAHGHIPTANWSSSFSPYHDETWCQLAPGVPMLCGYIPKDDLQAFALENEPDAWEQITSRQYAVFKAEPYQAMMNATYWRFLYPQLDMDGESAKRYMAMMLDCFTQLEYAPTQTHAYAGMGLRMHKLIHNSRGVKITVSDLARECKISNKTLIKGSYELFGTKPNNVLKQANLDRAHQLLSNRGMQDALGLKNVGDIMSATGFKSRSRFSDEIKWNTGHYPNELMRNAA